MHDVSVKKTIRTSLVATVLASVVLCWGGCSRSKPTEDIVPPPVVSNTTTTPAPDPERRPPPFTNPPAVSLPPAAASNVAPVTIAATPAQIQELATLSQQYGAATAFDDRFDLLTEIRLVGTAESVKSLERLFRTEKDGALREELINALIGIGGCKDEKLVLLRLGIAADQPPPVREAAIDGLVDLEDARALPLLKELSADANDQVRTVAKQAHALLTEMLKSP